jgi:hypothetical protein
MAQSNDELSVPPPSQRRARQQLSCTLCRAGKLKCDRKTPCDSCVKRAREDLCIYLAPPVRKSKIASNTKQRIAHLENLVIKLMKQRATDGKSLDAQSAPNISHLKINDTNPDVTAMNDDSHSPVYPEQSDSATAIGQLKLSREETTSYVGDTHWEAVLASVCPSLAIGCQIEAYHV